MRRPLIVAGMAAVVVALLLLSSCVRSCSADGDSGGDSAQPSSSTAATTTAGTTAAGGGDPATHAADDASEGEGSAQGTDAIALPASVVGFAESRKKGPITTTPRDEWEQGSIPFLYQKDPEWSAVSYADGTVGSHGCGSTCLSMAYVALTGDTSMDPAAMCAFSEQNGFVEAGTTAWRLMDEGAPMLGLTVHPVLTEVSGIRAALEAGQILIQSCDPGDFTTRGHFILICGIDENDQLTIHDPNSSYNSAVTWDAQRVLDQHSNIWGFTYDG